MRDSLVSHQDTTHCRVIDSASPAREERRSETDPSIASASTSGRDVLQKYKWKRRRPRRPRRVARVGVEPGAFNGDTRVLARLLSDHLRLSPLARASERSLTVTDDRYIIFATGHRARARAAHGSPFSPVVEPDSLLSRAA